MAIDFGDWLMVFRSCCRGWYAVVGNLMKDVYNVVVISPAELDT